MPITTILSATIFVDTPAYTNWFLNAEYLYFKSTLVGEYDATGQFLEVNCSLWAEVEPGISRLIPDWRGDINTRELIKMPLQEYGNDLFPFRLLLNPSFGFEAEILVVSP